MLSGLGVGLAEGKVTLRGLGVALAGKSSFRVKGRVKEVSVAVKLPCHLLDTIEAHVIPTHTKVT